MHSYTCDKSIPKAILIVLYMITFQFSVEIGVENLGAYIYIYMSSSN